MSLKKLFSEENKLLSAEPLSKDDFKDEVESFDYAFAIKKRDARFLAIENFDDPSSFARYGSAEKYYHDSISHVFNSYPYDGSLKEKILWELSSSLLDIYLLENGYPRTTGYANFLTSVATSGEEGTDYYPPSGDDEYILVKGGPHPGTGANLYYDRIKDEVVYRKDANVLDLEQNRENNLLIDGTQGNTIEFWLKKDAYVADQEYFECIYDSHVTGTIRTDSTYGRFTLSLATTGTTGQGAGNPKAFNYTYQSGTTKITNYIGASALTTASIADGNWHHYALRIKASGSDTVADLFVDGRHNDRQTTSALAIGYVSGAIVASVGAQVFSIDNTISDYGARGWSKFSGSIDELRYWKTWRTSKKIQRYWFDQVGGGTNTDLSNTSLGAYFKFNEGITGDVSIDSTALDYSGRVSNGTWTGYSSASRNTGSAIDSADPLMTAFSGSEFRDPIIYSTHPSVSTYLTNMKASGSVYDDTNTNSMASYIPSWIMEENYTEDNIKDKNYLTNLLQLISNYFDEASLLIEKLPNLVQQKYYSGVANPPPFNKKGLDSVGFVVPELFIPADLLEKFEDRDDQLKFEKTLQEVKTTIYQNIYNNLNHIYKSKGTIKSFRNLFHCFGLGDEIVKFNLYANNTTYKLEDNLKFTTKNKNYINFNEIENSDASVYQYKIDSTSTSFISGTGVTDGTYENAGLSFTLESNVILPNRVKIADYHTVKESYEGKAADTYPLIVSSSLFGVHSANSTENNLTWAADDYANFQVLTIKDDKYSSNAYFKLTGTTDSAIPALTSSLFEDVYDDQLWTVAVTVEPTKKESSNQVSGSDTGAASTYTVRFYGVSYIADYKAQEFLVTGTMTNAQGHQFISSRKRCFVGAHRNNFTGSTVNLTDVKVNSCKAWMNTIPTGTIDEHNLKLGNYGPKSSTQNAYLYQESVNGINIPEVQTLALMWDFSTVTGSDTNGEFSVLDESSGSATDNRYSWFSDVVSRRHTASGSFFKASSANVVQSLDRGTYQSQLPEILLDSNLTRILSQDDEYFNRNTRPVTYHLSIEKNMFHDVSEEMLNMFGSIVWFNNMIGNPVNVYRGEYKELKKAADLFFEKVGNDYDFDRYVDYFKLIDTAVSYYILELIPASMLTFEDGVSTMIENFVLGDRDKFAHKYPLMKDVKPKEIIGEALGINEQLYNWKFGHAPVSSDPNEQDDNCLWWSERAKATNVDNDTGDADVDKDRQSIQDAKINETNAPDITLYDSTTSQVYSGSTYATRRLATVYKINASEAKGYYGGTNFSRNKVLDFVEPIYRKFKPADVGIRVDASSLTSGSCLDDKELNSKPDVNFVLQVGDGTDDTGYVGELVAPYNIVSSTVEQTSFTGVNLVNIHNDTYGYDKEVPAQGPFTEKFVGGKPYRHTWNNFSSSAIPGIYLNAMKKRAEGWQIDQNTTRIWTRAPIYPESGLNIDLPRSVFYREETAKRPVNIKNIQQKTGSDGSNYTVLGNYSQGYEIVLTNGRSINNRFLAEGDGDLGATTTDSPYVSGVVDFTLPRFDLTGTNKYIIVNRFSAPGDPATMAEGMLDITSGEYSVYNALPWRNLNNRLSLNELYRDHAKQFGYFSDYYYSSSWAEAIRNGIDDLVVPGSYPPGSGSVNSASYYAHPANFYGLKGAAYLDATASFQKNNRNTRRQPFLSDLDLSDNFRNTKLLSFNGTSEMVDVGTAATWDALIGNNTAAGSSEAYTFSFWINPTELDHAGGSTIPNLVNFGEGIIIYIEDSGELQLLNAFSTTSMRAKSAAATILTGTFQHVAVTYDASSAANIPKAYINGEEITFTIWQTPVGTNDGISSDCIIGGRTTGWPSGHRFFKGYMDEISIWDDILTPSQIKEIYDGASPYIYRGGVGDLITHSTTNKLVSWWRGDGSSGTTLNDDAGSNDGTLIASGMLIDNDGSAVEQLLPVIAYHPHTGKAYDNWFVQHQIPQTDVQYAWITASIISGYSGSALYGYEQKGFSRADLASSDLTFITNSIVASVPAGPSAAPTARYYGVDSDYGWPFNPSLPEYNPPLTGVIPTDFVNLNTIVYEPLTSSTNILGYPAALWNGAYSTYINRTTWTVANGAGEYQYVAWDENNATVLNSILLNRHGPYGGANWKLYKKDSHPIVRHQNNNNIIGFVEGKHTFSNNPFLHPHYAQDFEIKNYTDPPITSKFKPLLYITQQPVIKGKVLVADPIKNLASLGNLRVHFADHTKETPANRVNLDLKLPTGRSAQTLNVITYSPYASFKKYIEESQNFDNIQVNYVETVYPKGLYTYLSGSRKRINFKNDFWRDDRDNRTVDDNLNSLNAEIDVSSIWKLDAHSNFTTSTASIPVNASALAPEKDGSGELQNAYSLFHYGSEIIITAAPSYIRRTKLIHQSYAQATWAPTGDLWSSKAGLGGPIAGLDQMIPYADGPGVYRTLAPAPARLSGAVGDDLWEVTTSAGAKPFYDSYDDYAEEGFRNLKAGTILPEFRISEKMDDYIAAGLKLNYASYNPFKFYGLEKDSSNPLKLNNGALTLTGSSIRNTSTEVDEFLQRYVFSDFYKYFTLIEGDYNNEPERIPTKKLVCEAMLKFLPYDGFYPSQRCAQLAGIFSESLADSQLNVERTSYTGENMNHMRTAMQPYFAPGILFNSIKSGIAVDYPIFTQDAIVNITSSVVWGNAISGNFSFRRRLNIDDLLSPPSIRIVDAEVDPDLALNSTASILSFYPKHTFAMSNFLAETVNTFTMGQSHIYSKPYDPSETIVPPISGDYTLDIVLRNSKNITSDDLFTSAQTYMLGGVNSFPKITSSLQVNTASITMYDRAITGYNIDTFLYGSSFGIPTECGVFCQYVPPGVSSAHYTASQPYYYGTTFDPFTPSYYNGYSRARLSVPLRAGQDYDMSAIISSLTHSYDRLHTFAYPTILPPLFRSLSVSDGLTATTKTTSYENAMQLSASLYLGDANINNIIYQRPDGTDVEEIICFKSRWETPVLDFTDAVPTEMYVVTGNIAKGMWHQNGVEPINKGISLEASHNSDYSLASVINFDLKQQKYIGELRNQHKFSEAIIAIPFKYNEVKKETQLYDADLAMANFITNNIYFDPQDIYDPAAPIRTYEEISTLIAKIEGIEIDESMYNLIAMMRNYVMPPHLDWVHNPSLRAYTMYMIEYSVDLDKEDIKNMWQNIEPTFARKALKVRSETNAYSFQVDGTEKQNTTFFTNDPFKDNETRWAIFKVKRRARSNYNSVVGKISAYGHKYIRKDLIGQTKDFLYSYNWPYDFFSLIELAKIDSINTFNPIYNEDKLIKSLSNPTIFDIDLDKGDGPGSGDG